MTWDVTDADVIDALTERCKAAERERDAILFAAVIEMRRSTYGRYQCETVTKYRVLGRDFPTRAEAEAALRFEAGLDGTAVWKAAGLDEMKGA